MGMNRLNLSQIQRDDTTLLNMYRDFVVLDQEKLEEGQIESRRKFALNLVEYIESHISVLENQVDGDDDIDRFVYITDRILFWKNMLLHQFRVFYESKAITVPKLFE